MRRASISAVPAVDVAVVDAMMYGLFIPLNPSLSLRAVLGIRYPFDIQIQTAGEFRGR